MTESAYQKWLKKDREWMDAYCRYARKFIFRRIVPLILVLLMILFGMEGTMDGGLSNLAMGIVKGLMRGVAICGIYLAIILPRLIPATHTWRLKKSIRKLSIYETEKEILGKEMLAALNSGERVVSYQLTDPTNPGTPPGRVILTSHYILQEEHNCRAVLVRLSDIAKIHVDSEKKVTMRGGKLKPLHFFTLYTLGFYTKDRFERGLDENDSPDYVMEFFQENIRNEVVKMMRKDGIKVPGNDGYG